MRLVPLFLALLLVAPACGRKKQPPPPALVVPVEAPKPAPVQAPKEVPAELKNLVQKEWDRIAADGAAFEKKFQEANIARDNNDRAAMDVAIEDANRHYQAAAKQPARGPSR